MTTFTWNGIKNEELKRDRGVSFERVVTAIEAGGLLANVPHPNPTAYPDQWIYVVRIDDYAYAVPYVPALDGGSVFLKTVFPSRKLTRVYLGGDR